MVAQLESEEKKMVMPVTLRQLTEARGLVETIGKLEALIAHFSGLPKGAPVYIHFEYLGGTGLAEEVQVKPEYVVDMLGTQCDEYITRLEELGFSIDE